MSQRFVLDWSALSATTAIDISMVVSCRLVSVGFNSSSAASLAGSSKSAIVSSCFKLGFNSGIVGRDIKVVLRLVSRKFEDEL